MHKSSDDFDIIPEKSNILQQHIHKLNNLITIIQGNTELIKLNTGSNDEVENILICCKKGSEVLLSLRQITSQIGGNP